MEVKAITKAFGVLNLTLSLATEVSKVIYTSLSRISIFCTSKLNNSKSWTPANPTPVKYVKLISSTRMKYFGLWIGLTFAERIRILRSVDHLFLITRIKNRLPISIQSMMSVAILLMASQCPSHYIWMLVTISLIIFILPFSHRDCVSFKLIQPRLIRVKDQPNDFILMWLYDILTEDFGTSHGLLRGKQLRAMSKEIREHRDHFHLFMDHQFVKLCSYSSQSDVDWIWNHSDRISVTKLTKLAEAKVFSENMMNHIVEAGSNDFSGDWNYIKLEDKFVGWFESIKYSCQSHRTIAQVIIPITLKLELVKQLAYSKGMWTSNHILQKFVKNRRSIQEELQSDEDHERDGVPYEFPEFRECEVIYVIERIRE